MKKNKLQTWNLAFSALFGIIGMLIGITIIYFTTGKFDLSLLLGGLTGATILIMINLIKVLMKKDNLPETDERVQKNVKSYLFFSSHIFIGLLFVALTIITLLGFKSISLTYLWI